MVHRGLSSLSLFGYPSCDKFPIPNDLKDCSSSVCKLSTRWKSRKMEVSDWGIPESSESVFVQPSYKEEGTNINKKGGSNQPVDQQTIACRHPSIGDGDQPEQGWHKWHTSQIVQVSVAMIVWFHFQFWRSAGCNTRQKRVPEQKN